MKKEKELFSLPLKLKKLGEFFSVIGVDNIPFEP